MQATHKVIVTISGAILLIMFGVAMSFWSFQQIENASEVRKHTNQILSNASNLLSVLKDAETGQRGYLLTDDEKFLEPYLAVHSAIKTRMETLRRMTQVNAASQHLDTAASLIDAKMLELSQVIELARKHDMPSALAIVKDGQGKVLMDSIRTEMSNFIKIEEDTRNKNDAEFESNMRQMFTLIVISSLLTLFFAVAFAYLIYRGAQQRLKNLVHLETKHLLEAQEEMNKQLQQTNATLQVSGGKKELSKAIRKEITDDWESSTEEQRIIQKQ
jgi:CHASE3 domain sensor protein